MSNPLSGELAAALLTVDNDTLLRTGVTAGALRTLIDQIYAEELESLNLTGTTEDEEVIKTFVQKVAMRVGYACLEASVEDVTLTLNREEAGLLLAALFKGSAIVNFVVSDDNAV